MTTIVILTECINNNSVQHILQVVYTGLIVIIMQSAYSTDIA
nr:MAG TPA: hypothetical protein [Caudoviricetes sp.]